MPTIYFQNENLSIEVPEGTTILEGARKAGVSIESPCNGTGVCGKCRIKLSRSLPGEEGAAKAQKEETTALACQTRVTGDIRVRTLPRENNGTLKILHSGDRLDVPLEPRIVKKFLPAEGRTLLLAGGERITTEAGDTTVSSFGAVVDIGTTTLVVSLIDLTTGKELASASALNPQAVYAQDVLSRINFAQEEEGLKQLNAALIRKLNEMIGEIADSQRSDMANIYEAVYSGNTCMLHLAANESPLSLGKYPYTPRITGGSSLSASANGLGISPHGLIYLPPVISAYVGADITSGILATRLQKRNGTTLFVDIGTNGEMVIARDGVLSATSTAAGPAFEGMNITCGMRAAAGAGEYFEIQDGKAEFRTIGNLPPAGICGSGLLDLAGELVSCGAVTKSGRFETDVSKLPEGIQNRLTKREGKTVFVIDGGVTLTQKDIRQIQLAKGAVRAGIEYLLKSADVRAGEVDEVLIAGSFGYHLRAKSLIHIGLLPGAFEGKIRFVGNTSQTGGEAFLLNRSCREEMEGLVRDVKVLELANYKDFDRLFVGCLPF